jgi:hypothetical protein
MSHYRIIFNKIKFLSEIDQDQLTISFFVTVTFEVFIFAK